MPARSLGKAKTMVQILAVGWALLPFTADADWLVQGFFAAALTLTLVSGVDLVRRGQHEDVFVLDLGLEGVFIERAEELPVGEEGEITLPWPGSEVKSVTM